MRNVMCGVVLDADRRTCFAFCRDDVDTTDNVSEDEDGIDAQSEEGMNRISLFSVLSIQQISVDLHLHLVDLETGISISGNSQHVFHWNLKTDLSLFDKQYQFLYG